MTFTAAKLYYSLLQLKLRIFTVRHRWH